MNRLTAILAIVLLLPAACAVNADSTTTASNDRNQPAIDDSSVTLGLGESKQLSDGSRLSYLSLVNDSRCPPDVQCIWAGDAEIALRWKPTGGSAQDLRLHTNTQGGANSARIGERTLTLVTLERGIGPKATLSIEATP